MERGCTLGSADENGARKGSAGGGASPSIVCGSPLDSMTLSTCSAVVIDSGLRSLRSAMRTDSASSWLSRSWYLSRYCARLDCTHTGGALGAAPVPLSEGVVSGSTTARATRLRCALSVHQLGSEAELNEPRGRKTVEEQTGASPVCQGLMCLWLGQLLGEAVLCWGGLGSTALEVLSE